MADQHTPVEVAVAFVEAFGRGDLAGAADRVAADIVFTSPRVTLTAPAPCWRRSASSPGSGTG